MKRLLLALMVLGSAHAIITQTETERPKSPFQPAETLSVTDIAVPFAGTGTVVLDVLITETGEIQKIEVRRDIALLTPLAVQAVEDWKFSSATLAGKAIASRMPVAVTFRPASFRVGPVPLPALIPQSEAAKQAEFQPAEVTRATFPQYPFNASVWGAVVLEVTLSEKGEPEEDVKVLRDLPPFTDKAKAEVGNFRFMAATFNGHPLPSKIVLAFVSSTPYLKPLAPPLNPSPP